MLCGKVSFYVDFLWVANFGWFSLLSLLALFRLLGVFWNDAELFVDAHFGHPQTAFL